MRFIYTAGNYTCYMGRMFAYKKPTEINDKATIAALLKHPDFVRVEDEKQEERPKQETLPVQVKRPTLTARRK